MPDVRMDSRDAVVVVLRRAGRVLVIRRAAGVLFPGFWTPLSGRVHRGEDQREAVVRETLEEVGLPAEPLGKVWECDTEDGAFHLHWWLADAGPGDMRVEWREVADARWILPDEFGHLRPTFADDRRFFDEILPNVSSSEQG